MTYQHAQRCGGEIAEETHMIHSFLSVQSAALWLFWWMRNAVDEDDNIVWGN
jgi:hypothetical protein